MFLGRVENVVFLDFDDAKQRAEEVGEPIEIEKIGWRDVQPQIAALAEYDESNGPEAS